MAYPNWLQKAQGGLLGEPDNYEGLLADQELQRARQQGMLSFGASLLQSSGPTAQPTGLGSALGTAMLAGNQGQQSAGQNAVRAMLLKKQLTEKGKKDLVMSVGPDGQPMWIDSNEAAGKPAFNPNLLHPVSSLEEWKQYNTMSPADQARYLEMKRAQQFKLGEVEGVTNVFTPSAGNAPGAPKVTVTPATTVDKQAAAKAKIAGSEAAAKTTATATAENDIALGSTLDEINKMRGNVSELINSPGFETIYGLSGKIDPRNYIPGTDAADAQAKRDQLSSEAFSITIQKMRGLGAMSDAEGKKITAAYTRATSPSISDNEARKAWAEVGNSLDQAEKRAREKAGKVPADTAPKETAAERAKRLGL